MQIEQFFTNNMWLLVLSLIVLPIKAVALWKAARLSHIWWFIFIFVTNTLGILDLIYIFVIARRYTVETKDAETVTK